MINKKIIAITVAVLMVFQLKKTLLDSAIKSLRKENARRLRAYHYKLIKLGRDNFFKEILQGTNSSLKLEYWENENLHIIYGSDVSLKELPNDSSNLLECRSERNLLMGDVNKASVGKIVYHFVHKRGDLSYMDWFLGIANNYSEKVEAQAIPAKSVPA